MPFITQGKTNWKFLLIVIILAIVVGGGVFAWQYWWVPKEEVKAPEVKAPKEITITSPSKGEIWKVGGTYQIRWTPSDSKGTVGIILSDTGISSASLSKIWQVENIPDAGNYSFTVPEVLPGDAYQIYISSKEKYGYSELFSIISKDETANWQTYRNDEYGFEVKYPEDWKFTTSSPSYEGSSSFETLDFSSLPPKLKGARLIVSTYQFKNELYKDWQTQVKGEGLTPNLFTTVDINKKECLKMMQEVKEYNSIAGIERYTESVSCTNDDGTRIVTLFIELERVNKEKYLAVFNQILSTFRFLEPVFVSPRGMEQWKIGETHTIEINRPVEDSYPFTHLTLNKADGEEIGIIACKIGGTGKTYFDWETNIVLKFCGASSEEKIKNIEPGNYIIAITEDLVGERPILASSELFSIIGE